MRSYPEALATLKGRPSRKLENSTWLVSHPGDGPGRETIAVRLHSTDVVTYHEDGRIVLDSGGWRTSTTKDRMNNYAPARIWTDKGIWYISWAGGEAVAYADGITFAPQGDGGIITGAGPDPKAELKHRKRIRAYALAYVTALQAGDVPAPGAGDCFYCGLRDSSGPSHLESHLAEKYYVPSLLVNAMRFDGWTDTRMGYWLSSYWAPNATAETRARMDGRAQFARVLTKYLYGQLCPGSAGGTPSCRAQGVTGYAVR